jgi:hypothetical protein
LFGVFVRFSAPLNFGTRKIINVLYFPISIILLYFLKGKCTKFENGKPPHLRITLHFPFFGTQAMLLTAAIVLLSVVAF